MSRFHIAGLKIKGAEKRGRGLPNNRLARRRRVAAGGSRSIAKRLSELLRTDTLNAPTERGGRYFFTKRLGNEDLARFTCVAGAIAPDEVLVDPLLERRPFASATMEAISKDGKLLFTGGARAGQDEVTVHVLDVDKKMELLMSFPVRIISAWK